MTTFVHAEDNVLFGPISPTAGTPPSPTVDPAVTSAPVTDPPAVTEPPRQPPPVVLLIDALANNGAVHIMVDLARRWARGGARLAVVQRLGQPPELAVPADLPLDHLTKKRQRLSRSLPMVAARLVAVTRGKKAIVSGSEIGIGVVLGFFVAAVTRKRFIVSVHADLDDALTEWVPARLRGLFYWIHRHAHGAICVAPGVVAPLVRNGLPASRIRVVRNGIDVAAVKRASEAGENLVDPTRRVIVATGRLAHQKGYDVLFRAHAAIVAQYPHHILVLNDGAEKAALRQLADELGVSDSIEFAGGDTAPLASVAHADVFCLPSRHEGLPLALLEAVSLGVPCIATDSSEGVRAALDDGRVGELVPVDDVAALAGALGRHLADPAPLRAKAALGPAHSLAFDSSAMADGWASAIDEFVR